MKLDITVYIVVDEWMDDESFSGGEQSTTQGERERERKIGRIVEREELLKERRAGNRSPGCSSLNHLVVEEWSTDAHLIPILPILSILPILPILPILV